MARLPYYLIKVFVEFAIASIDKYQARLCEKRKLSSLSTRAFIEAVGGIPNMRRRSLSLRFCSAANHTF